MKTVEKPVSDVGVIVGRFQVHELTAGHIDLIETVSAKHSKMIIFLGLSPVLVTTNNPLDFESRKQMLLEKYPNIIVLYIKDMHSDSLWSKELDEKIGDITTPNQSVTLYGSRDSFISHYTGRYSTEELVQEVFVSGNETRKSISKKVKNTPEFRAGVIWGAFNRYPVTYPTVDIAIFDEPMKRILLGRKPKEEKYRFVGGFAEPKSESYEQDAVREVREEAGDIEIAPPEYVGSFRVDDWRYKNEVDKIKTLFFVTRVLFGSPKAGDDICEVKFFNFKEFDIENLIENHRILWQSLVIFMKDRKVL